MYTLFLIPIASAIIAQALKLILDGVRGNFDVRHMIAEYGGMPSSHTAFVVSLTTIVGLREGVTSAVFAVALIFAIIVIRDAIGFRRTLGRQSKALNLLLRDVAEKKRIPVPTFHEEMGHNPLEVLVGGVIGFLLSVVAVNVIGW